MIGMVGISGLLPKPILFVIIHAYIFLPKASTPYYIRHYEKDKPNKRYFDDNQPHEKSIANIKVNAVMKRVSYRAGHRAG